MVSPSIKSVFLSELCTTPCQYSPANTTSASAGMFSVDLVELTVVSSLSKSKNLEGLLLLPDW